MASAASDQKNIFFPNSENISCHSGFPSSAPRAIGCSSAGKFVSCFKPAVSHTAFPGITAISRTHPLAAAVWPDRGLPLFAIPALAFFSSTGLYSHSRLPKICFSFPSAAAIFIRSCQSAESLSFAPRCISMRAQFSFTDHFLFGHGRLPKTQRPKPAALRAAGLFPAYVIPRSRILPGCGVCPHRIPC